MKRIISVLLSLIIITACSVGYADEMGAQFELANISTNTALASNTLTMNITLPSAVEDGTLIVAFYTDGDCTRVIIKDVSATNNVLISRVEITPTPDKIKLMLWEKDRIKPLASAQDALTQEVCQNANTKVLTLLDDLSSTSNVIRSMLGQSDNSVSATEIRALLDSINACITKVKEGRYSQNYLLTSEYCNKEFSDEIGEIQNNFKSLQKENKDRLNAIYTNPEFDEKNIETINTFIKFLNIDMDLL